VRAHAHVSALSCASGSSVCEIVHALPTDFDPTFMPCRRVLTLVVYE
jgi:hypothetical protein